MLLGAFTLVVVGEADAGPEGLHQAIGHPGVALAGEHGGGVGGLVHAGQHEGGLGFHLEGLAVGREQQFGRRLAPEPLPQPALVEAGRRRQVTGGDRSGAVQGLVDPEAYTQVDHEAHHLALLVAPRRQRVPAEEVPIDSHLRGVPSVMPLWGPLRLVHVPR